MGNLYSDMHGWQVVAIYYEDLPEILSGCSCIKGGEGKGMQCYEPSPHHHHPPVFTSTTTTTMYTSTNASINTSLSACVSSLRDSTQLLSSTISILDQGTHDAPRTTRAIQSVRAYELISEPELFGAQRELASEIGPEVGHLLRRVETHLAKLERREKSLVSRAELQEGRIAQGQPRIEGRKAQGAGARMGLFATDERAARQERLRMLGNKRERLEHTLERLALQLGHKVCCTLDEAARADGAGGKGEAGQDGYQLRSPVRWLLAGVRRRWKSIYNTNNVEDECSFIQFPPPS